MMNPTREVRAAVEAGILGNILHDLYIKVSGYDIVAQFVAGDALQNEVLGTATTEEFLSFPCCVDIQYIALETSPYFRKANNVDTIVVLEGMWKYSA
jgi:hypothetical protein